MWRKTTSSGAAVLAVWTMRAGPAGAGPSGTTMRKLILLALSFLPVAANADLITLNSVYQGWYNPASGHAGAGNYAANEVDGFRNFVVFDLSTVVESITEASISILNPTAAGTWSLFDVTTDIAALTTPHSPGATTDAIHSDLGSGIPFGTAGIASGVLAMSLNTVSLNPNALASLNSAAGGLWAIGGANFADTRMFYNTGDALNGTGVGSIRLDLTTTTAVPEPGALALFCGGLFGIWSARRVRRGRLG